MPDRTKKTEAGSGPVKKRAVPRPRPQGKDATSGPLSVQIAPESLASLGAPPAGTAEPVTDTTPMPVTATADAPVVVTATEPIPVTLDAESLKGAAEIANKNNGKEHHEKPLATVIKGEGVTLSPTTTEQDDLVKEGQRRINLIWETTQSRIALLVVGAGILVNTGVVAMTLFSSREVSVTQLSIISGSLQFLNLTVGIVIGFYFSRINHQAKGGVGAQPELEAYTGR